jgi:hypothetical protein
MALTEQGLKLADIVVKGLVGAGIAGVLTFYGYTLEDQREAARMEAS